MTTPRAHRGRIAPAGVRRRSEAQIGVGDAENTYDGTFLTVVIHHIVARDVVRSRFGNPEEFQIAQFATRLRRIIRLDDGNPAPGARPETEPAT